MKQGYNPVFWTNSSTVFSSKYILYANKEIKAQQCWVPGTLGSRLTPDERKAQIHSRISRHSLQVYWPFLMPLSKSTTFFTSASELVSLISHLLDRLLFEVILCSSLLKLLWLKKPLISKCKKCTESLAVPDDAGDGCGELPALSWDCCVTQHLGLGADSIFLMYLPTCRQELHLDGSIQWGLTVGDEWPRTEKISLAAQYLQRIDWRNWFRGCLESSQKESSVKAGVQKISLKSICSMSILWSKAMLPEPEKLQIQVKKKAMREQGMSKHRDPLLAK